jgi:hypothetical protein
MHIISNIALRAAGIAVLMTSAAPLLAAPVAASVKAQSVSTNGDIQEYRRHRHYDHDRIDGGDIAAGIGILAGIAIIAGIANKAKNSERHTRGERYPERFPDPTTQDTRENTADRNDRSGDDVGSAVSLCSSAAERSAGGNARVEEIRSVTREGSGWQVVGDLSGGARSFTCATSGGRLENIRLSDGQAI